MDSAVKLNRRVHLCWNHVVPIVSANGIIEQELGNMVAGQLDLRRLIAAKSRALDPIEKSLSLRYAEVLALREAVRKQTSTLATKRSRRSDTKRGVNRK
jgi:hypothetical protein